MVHKKQKESRACGLSIHSMCMEVRTSKTLVLVQLEGAQNSCSESKMAQTTHVLELGGSSD